MRAQFSGLLQQDDSEFLIAGFVRKLLQSNCGGETSGAYNVRSLVRQVSQDHYSGTTHTTTHNADIHLIRFTVD